MKSEADVRRLRDNMLWWLENKANEYCDKAGKASLEKTIDHLSWVLGEQMIRPTSAEHIEYAFSDPRPSAERN